MCRAWTSKRRPPHNPVRRLMGHFTKLDCSYPCRRARIEAIPTEKESKAMQQDEVVWTTILDGRYTMTVTRIVPYHGELPVSEAGQLLHLENTGLMYDALFGPDIDDVRNWRRIAVEVVDGAGKSLLLRSSQEANQSPVQKELNTSIKDPDEDTSCRVPDLNSAAERKRLSPSALRIFFRIGKIWKLSQEQRLQILGVDSEENLEAMRQNPDSLILSADQAFRVSYLIGIFKALNIIFGRKLADEWIRLPNKNVVFGGAPPITFMIEGCLPAMRTVRRMLDARRQGQ